MKICQPSHLKWSTRLTPAFDRAFAVQGAGLAPFLAVEDVAPGNAVMERLHEFSFHQILDEFDFEGSLFTAWAMAAWITALATRMTLLCAAAASGWPS